MQEEMESIQTNIKSRVIEIANFKGVSLEKFFLDLGVTYSSFKGQNKKSSLNSAIIERLHEIYPDVNLEWLISGKGPMVAAKKEVSTFLGHNNVYQSIIATHTKQNDETADLLSHKDELITELRNHISSLKNELDKKDKIISHLLSTQFPDK